MLVKRRQLFVSLIFISVFTCLYSVYFLRHATRVMSRNDDTTWIIVEVNRNDVEFNMDFYSSLKCTVLLLKRDSYSDYRIGNVFVMSKSPLIQYVLKGGSDSGYSLKNLGRLFAISKHADPIYEIESDMNTSLSNIVNNPKASVGLVNKEGILINPHLHFGIQPVSHSVVNISYLLTDINPYVEHCVTDRNDVVGILWKDKSSSTELTRYFQDSKAPSVYLARGQLSPFFIRNTVYRPMAYWAMFSLSVKPPELGEIYRNLIVQRLLWELNGTVGFHTSDSKFQNTIELSSEFKNRPKGKNIYSMIRLFSEFLVSWNCEKSFTFYECIIELTKSLTHHSFLKPSNIAGINAWLYGLNTVNYLQPQRIPPTPKKSKKSKRVFKGTQMIYTPISEAHSTSFYTKGLTSYCPKPNYTISDMVQTATPVLTHTDILLIVVFNFPHFNNIPNIQKLYGQSVSHILYCADNKTAFEVAAKKFDYQGSFIESDMKGGAYFYRCLTDAMKMDYKVRGYLLIGDDVLINPWKFKEFSLDKPWLINSTRYLHLNQTFLTWTHWHAFYGQRSLKAMFKDLQENYPEKYVEYQSNLNHNSGVNDGIFYGGADIAYIPSKLKDDALFYFGLYSKHRIYMEITFHSVIYGMAHREDMEILVDGYMWTNRGKYATVYKPYNFFIHPYKIGPMLKTKHGVDFFCKKYLPYLFGVKVIK